MTNLTAGQISVRNEIEKGITHRWGPSYAISPTTDFPSRVEIDELKEGDYALDCCGRLALVCAINGRGKDLHGRHFVRYSTLNEDESACTTMGRKERTITRTLALTGAYKSLEIDAMEKDLRERL